MLVEHQMLLVVFWLQQEQIVKNTVQKKAHPILQLMVQMLQ